MSSNVTFISAAFLSILASVAALGFLITQLIFMCFGRSKKKKDTQKTAKDTTGKNQGENSCLESRNVRNDRRTKEMVGVYEINNDKANISSNCDVDGCDGVVVNCDNGKNLGRDGDCCIATDEGDGGCSDGCDAVYGSENGDDKVENKDDILAKEGELDGEVVVCTENSDADDNVNDNEGIEKDVGDEDDDIGNDGIYDDSGNDGDDSGDGKNDGTGGANDVAEDGTDGEGTGKDGSDKDDDIHDDGVYDDGSRGSGNDGIEDCDNDAVYKSSSHCSPASGQTRDHGDDDQDVNADYKNFDDGGDNGINSGDYIGDDSSADDNQIDGIDDGSNGDGLNGSKDRGANEGEEVENHVCIKVNVGCDVAAVDNNHSNMNRDSELRSKEDADNIYKCCNNKHNNRLYTKSHCTTSNNTSGKIPYPGSSNPCTCECSHAGITASDDQNTFEAVHLQKQHIHFKLDVDITKYQITDGSEGYQDSCLTGSSDENLSDGEIADNPHHNCSQNQIPYTVPNACENACYNKTSTGKITSKTTCRSCWINIQQDSIKSAVKFCAEKQMACEDAIKLSKTIDHKHLERNTSDCSSNNDGFFLDDKFNKNLPPFEEIGWTGEAKTRDTAVQVFEDSSSGQNGRNSPTAFYGISDSSQNSSTISCCYSSEYEYRREREDISSSECSETSNCDENIMARKSIELCQSTEFNTEKYALYHIVNMDCIEKSEAEKEFKREMATNSTIFRRFVRRIINFAECCISALYADK